MYNIIMVNVRLNPVRALERFCFMEMEGDIVLFNQDIPFLWSSFMNFAVHDIHGLSLKFFVELPDVKLCPAEVIRSE